MLTQFILPVEPKRSNPQNSTFRDMRGMSSTNSIEEALKNLSVGSQIYIDRRGRVHLEKDALLRDRGSIICTLRRISAQQFEVHTCLKPVNPNYIVAKNREHLSACERAPLNYCAYLNSGDTVTIGELGITIPTNTITSPRTVVERIQNEIALASIGTAVAIGRTFQRDLPNIISRWQLTVKIQNKEELLDGSFKICVQIFPGESSKQPIWTLGDDGAREIVHGMKTVFSGTKLDLGDIGVVSIPHQDDSVEERSVAIHRELTQFREPLKTYVAASDRGEGTVDRCNSRHLRYLELVERGRAEEIGIGILEFHIIEGIKLIAAGKHTEAIKHFSEVDLLESLGYTFEQNNVIGLRAINESEIIGNIEFVASRSWFRANEKMVYPSLGVLHPDLVPTNAHEKELLYKWKMELALLYAEEWTHALQHASGGMVCRKAAILKNLGLGNEADVAVYFHENGQPLSYHFVKVRYAERAKGLILSHGAQSKDDEKSVCEAFRALPFGGRLIIGRAPIALRSGDVPVQLQCGTNNELKPEVQTLRNQAISAMEKNAIAITKLPSAKIELTSLAPGNFASDLKWFFNPLNDSVVVEPATSFYVGNWLRFSIS